MNSKRFPVLLLAALVLPVASFAQTTPVTALQNLAHTAESHGGTLFQAIRSGDLAAVKTNLTKSEIETRDAQGTTALMYATAFGNLETFKLLLAAGADVNARNTGDATALLWAARDPERARLLIEHGADVNARSLQGQTPLMSASLRRGNAAIVALLLSKGAEVDAKAGGRDVTSLGLAASIGDAESVRLLVAKGADPGAADRGGATPIVYAAHGHLDATRFLIQRGVDVNVSTSNAGTQRNGPMNRTQLTALHEAAAFGPISLVRDLLKAGANVHARDSRKLTPLFFALASEYPSIEIVQTLLRAGADVNATDNTGETPLDWAEKFRDPKVVALLKQSGASNGVLYKAPPRPSAKLPEPAVALARSITLLESTSAEFFKQSGCVSCHHQALIPRAQKLAKSAGISINETARREQMMQLRDQGIGASEGYLQSRIPGGGSNRLAEMLLGLRASDYPADAFTDAAISAMAVSQESDGRWAAGEVQLRPPLSESDVAATARVIQALQVYPLPARRQEFSERMDHAREWLKRIKPVRTEDFTMRLAGLKWAGAGESDLKKAADALIGIQRPDGGWGNNPYMDSDAYTSGEVLIALAESGVVSVRGSAYQKGVSYLLSTQFPDGSWHVRSRAIKFQPYFESGFPFGEDQWISTAATALAAQAIAWSMQPAAR